MEQSVQSDFRSKVFDQRTFDLFLEIVQFLGTCGVSNPMAQKIALDSFVFSNSIERSTQFFNVLNAFAARDVKLNLTNVDKFIPPFENFSDELFESFLLTLRTLAQSEKPVDLSLFFKAMHLILEKHADAADAFLKTSRQLPSLMQESGAPRFAQTVLNLKPSQPRLEAFFEAMRHCSSYFKTEESFIGIFKALSLVESELYYEAFSLGQLESKKWLIDEAIKAIGNNWGRVFVLAGWMGVLPRLIFDRGDIETVAVRNFDMDGNATQISETLNSPQVVKEWKYKSSQMDVRQLRYPQATFNVKRKDGTFAELSETPNLIINTSCEHIEGIGTWFESIPPGVTLILQNNNAFGFRDHHGCVSSLEEFKSQLPLRKVSYAGELDLGDYKRFMLIGKK